MRSIRVFKNVATHCIRFLIGVGRHRGVVPLSILAVAAAIGG